VAVWNKESQIICAVKHHEIKNESGFGSILKMLLIKLCGSPRALPSEGKINGKVFVHVETVQLSREDHDSQTGKNSNR
jgi:hypothetical protein